MVVFMKALRARPVAVRHGRPVFDIIQMLSETYGNAANAMPKMWFIGHAAFTLYYGKFR
jgi:hypothetical protein